jgi:hypothetical protein
LDLAALYPNTSVIAAVIARAAPLTAESPHLCQGTVAVTEITKLMTLLPSSAQWGPYLSPAAPSANPTRLQPGQRVVGTNVAATRAVGQPTVGHSVAPSSVAHSGAAGSEPVHSAGRSNGERAAGKGALVGAPNENTIGSRATVVRIPAQRGRTPAAVTIGAIQAIRSRYAGHEQSVAQSERLARGLEVRTRQLLGSSDE